MIDDLEAQLRNALRPVDPGEKFAETVLTRIENTAPSRRLLSTFRWQWAAVVAIAVVGTAATYEWQVRRAQGLEARRQLIEALQLTGEKLDVAYRAVNGTSRSMPDSRG